MVRGEGFIADWVLWELNVEQGPDFDVSNCKVKDDRRGGWVDRFWGVGWMDSQTKAVVPIRDVLRKLDNTLFPKISTPLSYPSQLIKIFENEFFLSGNRIQISCVSIYSPKVYA